MHMKRMALISFCLTISYCGYAQKKKEIAIARDSLKVLNKLFEGVKTIPENDKYSTYYIEVDWKNGDFLIEEKRLSANGGEDNRTRIVTRGNLVFISETSVVASAPDSAGAFDLQFMCRANRVCLDSEHFLSGNQPGPVSYSHVYTFGDFNATNDGDVVRNRIKGILEFIFATYKDD